jgi:hypothetical protein
MTKYKKKKDAVGNFAVYEIVIGSKVFKIGKADFDRVTHSSASPTRIHQQIQKLSLKYTESNVFFRYLKIMFNITTAEAVEVERFFLLKYTEKNGTPPEGNSKSFKNDKI